MNTMTAAFLTNAVRAITTTITAAVSAAARTASKPRAALAIPVAAPRRIRRRAQRRYGIFRSIGLIPPQYMPALARSQILRLRCDCIQVTSGHTFRQLRERDTEVFDPRHPHVQRTEFGLSNERNNGVDESAIID